MKSSTPSERPGSAPRAGGGKGVPPTLDHIPAVSMEELLAALSLALDLAEGRPKGHALRVCFITISLARELNLSRPQRGAAFFAGLLHDVGVSHASEAVSDVPRTYEQELFSGSPLLTPEALARRVAGDRTVQISDAFHEHAFEGASAIAALGLPPPVAEAVLCHHERYDGTGFPLQLARDEVPPVARVLAVADYAEALLTAESNPLLARRRLENALREQSGYAFHPLVVEAMARITRRDEFWLAFHNQELMSLLMAAHGHESRPMSETAILRTTGVFADVADAKNSYKRGHSRRVAAYARPLALATGMSPGRARAVELAALLHDIGMLRVPSRVISKPEILSVDEMHILHEHPAESAEIVRAIPAWSQIADWTAGHHERLDGRGYPDGLPAEAISTESRVLAIADIYAALTAHRPHRPALSPPDALDVMRGMVDANVDGNLIEAFERIQSRVQLVDTDDPRDEMVASEA